MSMSDEELLAEYDVASDVGAGQADDHLAGLRAVADAAREDRSATALERIANRLDSLTVPRRVTLVGSAPTDVDHV